MALGASGRDLGAILETRMPKAQKTYGKMTWTPPPGNKLRAIVGEKSLVGAFVVFVYGFGSGFSLSVDDSRLRKCCFEVLDIHEVSTAVLQTKLVFYVSRAPPRLNLRGPFWHQACGCKIESNSTSYEEPASIVKRPVSSFKRLQKKPQPPIPRWERLRHQRHSIGVLRQGGGLIH